MRNVLLRLSGSLVAVLALWTLVWLPLVLGESAAAEAEEQALGDASAPVTIIEYASLTCPHCAEFHQDVLPALKERYIAPGKVRLIYRDFPLDERALEAAVLAHCAGPERYFGFLDVLFETQSNWARAEDPRRRAQAARQARRPQRAADGRLLRRRGAGPTASCRPGSRRRTSTRSARPHPS